MRSLRPAKGYRFFLLLGLLLCALGLRLYGIDWDQGFFFHPDERFLLQFKLPELRFPWPVDWQLLQDPAKSPWNPRWFAYGSFPLYLLKGLSALVTSVAKTFPLEDVRFLGRGLSALADVGSILLLYLLGSKLYGWRTGMLAAAFSTFAVIHIQLSHFATFDVLLTFLVLVTLYGAVLVMEKGSLRGGLVVGIGLGLGLATKVSVAPILLPVGVAYLMYALFPHEQRLSRPQLDPQRVSSAVRSLGLALVVGIAVFLVAQPYTLLDWTTFSRDIQEQREMVLRIRDYPYTRQYESTQPYLYLMQQLAAWGLGWPLGLVSWLGLVFTLVRGLLRSERGDLLLLSWVVPYFLLTGAFPVKFLRYMLPVTPLLVLMGSHMLLSWRDRAAAWRRRRVVGGDVRGIFAHGPELVLGLALLGTVWYALAFTNIYREAHPAVRLSAWINERVPKGQLILKEHWEEAIPKLEEYRQSELALYEPDTAGKLAQLIQQLHDADYLVFFSNRLYGTIPRLLERYPMSSRYYQLLFSGQLGFDLAYGAETYPSFLGITWHNDTFSRPGLPTPADAEAKPPGLVLEPGYADESFTAYDHPKTLLFKKVRPLSTQEMVALLQPGLASSILSKGTATGLMLSPQDAAVQRAGGTWAELFPDDSLASRVPWLPWMLLVEFLGIVAFPIAYRLFSALPDRGFLLAKSLGLLLVGYCTWLVASLHLLPFTRSTILFALALLLVVSYLAALRQPREILGFLAARWKHLLSLEALFLLAFLAFYLVRLANPDLWHPSRGGEKPMDFAYLNAIVKSTFMPPYDPWYSGGYINYYYFGHFLVAVLIKVTGVLPEVAYNLAVPTLFSFFVGNLFSLGSGLVATHAVTLGQQPQAPAIPRAGGTPFADLRVWAAGLATAVLVALIGNLDGAAQVLEGLQRLGNIDVPSTIPGLSGLASAGAGLFHMLALGTTLPPFDFWRASRMMPPTISITEFPFFTFLFADLHAHLIVLPFTVLAVALAAQLVLTQARLSVVGRLGHLAVFGLVLGAIRWINSWDYPTMLLIGVLALVIADIESHRTFNRWLLIRVGVQALLLLAFSIGLFQPLQASYQLFYTGLLRSPETTPLHQYLLVHGLFLAVLGGFILHEGAQRFGNLGLFRLVRLLRQNSAAASRVWRLYRLLARRPDPPSNLAVSLMIGIAVAMLLLVSFGLTTMAFLVFFLSLVLPLVFAELLSPSYRGAGYVFALSLAGVAALLGILVELVTLQGDIQRMNTVFKFYLQAWVLYGVAAAYAACQMVWGPVAVGSSGADGVGHATTEPLVTNPLQPLAAPRRWSVARVGWGLSVAVLFLASLVYPIEAVPARTSDRFLALPPSSDGMDYMNKAVYQDERGTVELMWDHAGIRWLREHVKGSPVVLEAVTPIYRWGSRISIYTGLPTVLGWDWHQTQQRWAYRDQIEVRIRDVATLYSTPDIAQALELLKRYDVAYVYVGTTERLYYPGAGIGKFETMVAQGMLQKVYSNPQVTIYTLNS